MRLDRSLSIRDEQTSNQLDEDLSLIKKAVRLPDNDSLIFILAVGRWADEIRAK